MHWIWCGVVGAVVVVGSDGVVVPMLDPEWIVVVDTGDVGCTVVVEPEPGVVGLTVVPEPGVVGLTVVPEPGVVGLTVVPEPGVVGLTVVPEPGVVLDEWTVVVPTEVADVGAVGTEVDGCAVVGTVSLVPEWVVVDIGADVPEWVVVVTETVVSSMRLTLMSPFFGRQALTDVTSALTGAVVVAFVNSTLRLVAFTVRVKVTVTVVVVAWETCVVSGSPVGLPFLSTGVTLTSLTLCTTTVTLAHSGSCCVDDGIETWRTVVSLPVTWSSWCGITPPSFM
jgi:hypothetical protein